MDNNKKKQKENNSMYLYTALIFVVALLLILVAFFSQTNISRLGNRANEFEETYTAEPTELPQETQLTSEEFARISNMASALDTENKALKATIDNYDKLTIAHDSVINESYDEAQAIIDTIDVTVLSDTQKTLYDQIINKINKGKEQ